MKFLTIRNFMHNLIFMYNRLCYIGKICVWEEERRLDYPAPITSACNTLNYMYIEINVWELFSFFSVFFLERGGGVRPIANLWLPFSHPLPTFKNDGIQWYKQRYILLWMKFTTDIWWPFSKDIFATDCGEKHDSWIKGYNNIFMYKSVIGMATEQIW